jgi:hypothetical protein
MRVRGPRLLEPAAEAEADPDVWARGDRQRLATGRRVIQTPLRTFEMDDHHRTTLSGV